MVVTFLAKVVPLRAKVVFLWAADGPLTDHLRAAYGPGQDGSNLPGQGSTLTGQGSTNSRLWASSNHYYSLLRCGRWTTLQGGANLTELITLWDIFKNLTKIFIKFFHCNFTSVSQPFGQLVPLTFYLKKLAPLIFFAGQYQTNSTQPPISR